MLLKDLQKDPLEAIRLEVIRPIIAKVGIYEAAIKSNGKKTGVTVFEPTMLEPGDIIVIDGNRKPLLLNDMDDGCVGTPVRINSVAFSYERILAQPDDDLPGLARIIAFQMSISNGDLAPVGRHGLQEPYPTNAKTKLNSALITTLINRAEIYPCLYENDWELLKPLSALRAEAGLR